MTNEVIWTKIVLERFIEQANLSEDEEIVIRTRAAGWSRIKQAMELNLSVSTIDRIISRLKRKYDEVQASDPILPARRRFRKVEHISQIQSSEGLVSAAKWRTTPWS